MPQKKQHKSKTKSIRCTEGHAVCYCKQEKKQRFNERAAEAQKLKDALESLRPKLKGYLQTLDAAIEKGKTSDYLKSPEDFGKALRDLTDKHLWFLTFIGPFTTFAVFEMLKAENRESYPNPLDRLRNICSRKKGMTHMTNKITIMYGIIAVCLRYYTRKDTDAYDDLLKIMR